MLKRGETFVPGDIIKIKFTTIDLNYEDGNSFTLELGFAGTVEHSIWQNYRFPDIRVSTLILVYGVFYNVFFLYN